MKLGENSMRKENTAEQDREHISEIGFKKTKSVSLPKDIDQEMQSIIAELKQADRKMCVNYYITLAIEEYNKKHGKKG